MARGRALRGAYIGRSTAKGTEMNLRDAIEVLVKMRKAEPDGERKAALTVALRATRGLRQLYDAHELAGESGDSAADQCDSLYQVLNSVGMVVA